MQDQVIFLQKSAFRLFSLLLVVLFALPVSVYAASPKIKLKVAATSSASTKVVAKLTLNKKAAKKAHLVLLRSIDGVNFEPIAEFTAPRKTKVSFKDKGLSLGTVWYKGKLEVNSVVVWSSAVSETLEPDSFDPYQEENPTPNIPDTSLKAGQSECSASFAQEMLTRVNYYRAQSSLAPLQLHSTVSIAARYHTIWMASNNKMLHDGWFEEMWTVGLRGSHYGQNIARANATTTTGIVDAWMQSPGHRENILNSGYQFLGAGCVVDSKGMTWWTQDFFSY